MKRYSLNTYYHSIIYFSNCRDEWMQAGKKSRPIILSFSPYETPAGAFCGLFNIVICIRPENVL